MQRSEEEGWPPPAELSPTSPLLPGAAGCSCDGGAVEESRRFDRRLSFVSLPPGEARLRRQFMPPQGEVKTSHTLTRRGCGGGRPPPPAGGCGGGRGAPADPAGR